MAIRRSHPPGYRTSLDDDKRPRFHIPVIAALVGALAIVNVASAILAMID